MKAFHNNQTLVGCASAFICEILFGLSYLFTKQAIASASGAALLSWRFLVALAVMSLFLLVGIIKIDIRGKRLRPLFLIALFQPVIYFVAETAGISATTASESGSFLACIPIVTLVASSLFLKKKPQPMQAVGICVTLSGVLCCVLAKGMDASFSPFGYLMLCLAVVSYSLYCVFVEKSVDFSDIEKTYVMVAAGAIVFTAIAIAQNISAGTLVEYIKLPLTNRDFLQAILYQGLGCSVVAFFLSNVAIANIGTNRTASFVGISTAVSILAGVFILNESFSPVQAAGTILIIGGVYLANAALKGR
ncbi:DMT family transporter [Anaerovorax odorimutans]|uniref:DMT family transporter n=1 Tax=Anaerovorax odorimutans TaxID=109327 RepID=A0ABT1RKX6_9FIRM|nr:DMT family transporter [Anaerovorax odorimutans]MCQ4635606.1 DMT family transporter [Anaerovorax odorimutans]